MIKNSPSENSPRRNLLGAGEYSERNAKRRINTAELSEELPMVNENETQKTVQWLSKAIEEATDSAKFCVEGSLPGVDPELLVEGIGPIRLPLTPSALETLKSVCQVAPFGKGTETVVDKEVRNSLELDESLFSLGAKWSEAIASLMNSIALQLGLPADRLEAKPYKLLIYETGGFFLSHRDSEKYDRMVASLVVVLPNSFEGGSLALAHGGCQKDLHFSDAREAKSASYAAFFADCLHCINEVINGARLSLTYNLLLKPKSKADRRPSTPTDQTKKVAEAIADWVRRQPANPLVFPLQHLYTQRGLAFDLLKGSDRNLAELIVESAKKSDCVVHFAHIVRMSSVHANYGIHESWYFRNDRKKGDEEPDDFRDGQFIGTEWTNEEGKKQAWGQIELSSLAMIVPKGQLDWTKAPEEYEPYFGNYGRTLKRWYFQSAMVVWSRDNQQEIVGGSSGFGRMNLFCSMVQRLSKTPRKSFEEHHTDCVRLAHAIIDHWPKKKNDFHYYWKPPRPEKSPLDEFSKWLVVLGDKTLISKFLKMIAAVDDHLSLSDFIIESCKKFGWTAFSSELMHLATGDIKNGGNDPGEFSFRNMEWLSEYCCNECTEPGKFALAKELCMLASSRYRQRDDCEEFFYDTEHVIKPDPVLTPNISDASLPLLIKAIISTECHKDLSDLIKVILNFQDHFRMEACQVPTLKEVIPWAKEKLGSIPKPLSYWLNFVKKKLSLAITRKPLPPTSWARKGRNCCCPICENVNSFMFSPARKVFRYSGTEYTCKHIMILYGYGDNCDVRYSLKNSGSLYHVTLTKENKAYEKELARYERTGQALEDLSKLDQ